MASLGWGTLLQVGATVLGGLAQREQGKEEERALKRQALSEQASGQREAIERRRTARYVKSRARALAAASGGGTADPTIVNLMGDLDAEGEYQALTALWEGDEKAAGLRHMGAVRRAGGRAALGGSLMRAGATVLDYGQSLREKYG